MSSLELAAIGRVRALVRAAGRIADPGDVLGRLARDTLPAATGLSPEGVVLGLERHLETHPSDDELSALVGSVRPAARVHVVLSAGVFVAAHRAIALGLAASEQVFVKPSQRDPEMTRLLAEGAPDLFTVVNTIEPRAGDVVFAYGTDASLNAILSGLPPAVTFMGHGSGIGAAFVDLSAAGDLELREASRLLVDDVIPFDQRGCLSPRIVFVVGAASAAHDFCESLATALVEAEKSVPRGSISPDETARAVRYRETMRFAGDVFEAGSSWVGLDLRGERAVVPPPGRHVHVVVPADLEGLTREIHALVTAAGVRGSAEFARRVEGALPDARHGSLGQMQRPPFDGPVDRRRFVAHRASGASGTT